MQKTVGNAFNYMFKDKDWCTKFAGVVLLLIIMYGPFLFLVQQFIYFCINNSSLNHSIKPPMPALSDILSFCIPLLIIILFISIIYYFVEGYFARCTQNIIKNDTEQPAFLPEFKNNFFNSYLTGAKKYAAVRAIFTLIQPANICLFIPSLLLSLMKPALNRLYCNEFEFEAYFKWKEAYELISKNAGLYIAIVIIEILFTVSMFVFLIMFFIFKIHVALISLFMAIYSAYIFFVEAYLEAIVGESKKSSVATSI